MYGENCLARLTCSPKNSSSPTVRQLNVGSRWTQYRLICSPNRVGAPVAAGVIPKLFWVPRSQPTQSLLPSGRRGPSQILFTTAASAGVGQRAGSVDAPGSPQTAAFAS